MKQIEREEPAGKLWELLRRNDCFIGRIRRLTKLERISHVPDGGTAAKACDLVHRMLSRLDDLNPFASTALRWLVPQPLFILRMERAQLGDPLEPAKPRKLETVDLSWGLTPNPDEWKSRTTRTRRERAASDINLKGWPRRWGPRVETITTRARRLKRVCHDGIGEWNRYFARRQFTHETPWHEAPEQFREEFRQKWENLPGGSHTVAETDFFRDWDLADVLRRASSCLEAANRYCSELMDDLDRVARGGTDRAYVPTSTRAGFTIHQIPKFGLEISEKELAKVVSFRSLARGRVFRFSPLLLRSDVKPLLKKLERYLLHNLPPDRELLGTSQLWNTFRAVETIMNKEHFPFQAAVTKYVRRKGQNEVMQKARVTLTSDKIKRWFHDGKLRPRPMDKHSLSEWLQVKKIIARPLRDLDLRYRTDTRCRFEHIRSLTIATFPRLDFATLTARTPHKRNRSS